MTVWWPPRTRAAARGAGRGEHPRGDRDGDRGGVPADPDTGGLDRRAPGVGLDLAGSPPRTLPGQLALAAAERVRRGLPALSVVVCDNVHDGGPLLRRLSAELAAGRGDDVAAHALTEEWAFPRTVVDRVVPAVPADREPHVLAEPWFRWLLEDRFAGPRPAWELAGAQVVEDVAPWRAAKLLLLNAPHSLLAYLGLARGHRSVDEAVADPVLRRAWTRRWPPSSSLRGAARARPGGRGESAVHRFANRRDRTGWPRSRRRLPQAAPTAGRSVQRRLAAGAVPHWLTLALACWAQAVHAGPSRTAAPTTYGRRWDGPGNGRDRARRVLGLPGLAARGRCCSARTCRPRSRPRASRSTGAACGTPYGCGRTPDRGRTAWT